MKPDVSGMAVSVLQALPQPVIICDETNLIVFVNYAAEAFFGASLSVLRRQRLHDLIAFGSPIVSLVETVSARRAPMTEYRVSVGSSRFGDERVVDVYASPMSDNNDGLVALLFQERTMADKIDRQLVSRGAARSVTGLASMLAHEIKNPLSGIRGAAQLIASGGDAGGALTTLIITEVDRIAALIDRMQDFTDTRPLTLKPENIYPLLSHVRQVALAGFARGIAIEERFDPSLPEVLIDRDAFLQVVLNLIKNACEVLAGSPEPRLVISTGYRHGMAVGGVDGSPRLPLPIEICITDSGPGAPPDIADHLFEPFVSGKPEGQGLGLALVDKLVRDMSGIVQYGREGDPEMTVFRILLPRAPR